MQPNKKGKVKEKKKKQPHCNYVTLLHPERRCIYCVNGICTFSGYCSDKSEPK